MTTPLPIRELVLYKNGIGYFVRSGRISGDVLSMAFDESEINDVLKSLNVADNSGGQVLGIHYDTPIDEASKVANNAIRMTETESLHTLLRSLRGRTVQITVQRKGDTETISGRVMGLDVRERVTWVSVLQADGHVRVLRLEQVRDLLIVDDDAQQDLRAFLDANQSESERRTVHVQLSEGDHDLAVSYVAPSPNWRVSYRVIAQATDDSSGAVMLLGWGLFDNRIEDLNGVKVTLVAGAPISFQYDLYSSSIPERQRVQDEGYAAQGPVQYAAAPRQTAPQPSSKSRKRRDPLEDRLNAPLNDALSLEEMELSMSFKDRVLNPFARRRVGGGANKQIDSRMEIAALRPRSEAVAASLGSTSTGREAGEVFQYDVTEPVTVKKGVSALVPIINQGGIPYRRELLYNAAKVKDHPVAALRFKNTTGLTLEQGPVTVVENDDYKGEALVSFTRDGAELYLPYAVEHGVRVVEKMSQKIEEGSSSIQGLELVERRYHVITTTYTLENNTNTEKTVRIEAAKQTDYDLVQTMEPEEETAEFWRWSITVEPNSSKAFTRVVRKTDEHTQIIAGGCNPIARLVAWMMGITRGRRTLK